MNLPSLQKKKKKNFDGTEQGWSFLHSDDNFGTLEKVCVPTKGHVQQPPNADLMADKVLVFA